MKRRLRKKLRRDEFDPNLARFLNVWSRVDDESEVMITKIANAKITQQWRFNPIVFRGKEEQ